ncbi:hypothetical protein LP420_32695 [Massilia sp. B-10]|nr:hypothetical protein LP420_32695 [Massilia sp. B-10]
MPSVVDGSVNDATFGTQPHQTSITGVTVDAAVVAANGGKLDGYLFGLRARSASGVKLPIVSGAVMLSR